MPTYEYLCPKCGTRFERVQKITDPPRARCPKCRARAERQLSGGAGIVFKGSGFYVTDYKRAEEKRKAKREGGKDSAKDSTTPGGGTSGPSSTSGPKD